MNTTGVDRLFLTSLEAQFMSVLSSSIEMMNAEYRTITLTNRMTLRRS
jgi:hypothetical protein